MEIPSLGQGILNAPQQSKLPEYELKSEPQYIFNSNFADAKCQSIIHTLGFDNENVESIQTIGFDIEWPVEASQYGGKRKAGKVSTVQLALDNGQVFVFDLARMKCFPGSLATLLQNPLLRLVGQNISGDISQLKKDYSIDIPYQSCIELSHLCFARNLVKSKKVSLQEICKAVLALHLQKDEEVRTSPVWGIFEKPLPEHYIKYAAKDAMCSLDCYQKATGFPVKDHTK